MTRIKILVEGQTEETFIRDSLVNHYANQAIYITPILAETSPGHKGGIVNYTKVKNQIEKLCKEDKNAFVTTMIDFYGLPPNFPGIQAQDYPSQGGCLQQVDYLEGKLASSINLTNFIPNLTLHEYEAYLFCDIEKFDDWIDEGLGNRQKEQLQAIVDEFDTPEHINNNPNTAPSKRIKAIIPQYKKTLQGPIIAEDIGLDKIREQCSHFDAWLRILEALKEN